MPAGPRCTRPSTGGAGAATRRSETVGRRPHVRRRARRPRRGPGRGGPDAGGRDHPARARRRRRRGAARPVVGTRARAYRRPLDGPAAHRHRGGRPRHRRGRAAALPPLGHPRGGRAGPVAPPDASAARRPLRRASPRAGRVGRAGRVHGRGRGRRGRPGPHRHRQSGRPPAAGLCAREPLPDLPELFRVKAAREVVDAVLAGAAGAGSPARDGRPRLPDERAPASRRAAPSWCCTTSPRSAASRRSAATSSPTCRTSSRRRSRRSPATPRRCWATAPTRRRPSGFLRTILEQRPPHAAAGGRPAGPLAASSRAAGSPR